MVHKHYFTLLMLFRNIVIIADIRLLLCLNIVICYFHFIRNNIFLLLKKMPSRVTTIPMLGLLVTAYGVGCHTL